MGAGDEVPKALQNLGYDVVELSDETLENADLSPFDAIITGVRAYNTRDILKLVKDRLLQYVDRGGTLVVQYNVASGSAGRPDRPLSLHHRQGPGERRKRAGRLSWLPATRS